VPGSWAPAHACWALGNRAALIRVPGRGENRRIEHRSGDGTANPYLLLGGLLAAVVDGISRELEPPPPVEADVGHWTDEEEASADVARLPGTLGSALEALEADDVLLAMLGPTIAPHYVAVKRYEAACFAEAGAGKSADVTDWEQATYLEPL
jgi:glutamine synthetase